MDRRCLGATRRARDQRRCTPVVLATELRCGGGMNRRCVAELRSDNHRMADLPIACTLSPEALKARRENRLDTLLQRSTERTELPDGLRLRFTADAQILAEIARTVEAERQCCRFLSFTITVSPDG